MHYSVQQIFLILSLGPMVLALVIGAIRFRRLPVPLRLLTGLVALACATEVVARVLWFQKKPNLFLLPFYTTAEFAFIAAIYWHTLTGGRIRRWLPVAVLAFGVYSIVSFVFDLGTVRFNSIPLFVESLAVMGLVFLFFRQLLRDVVVVQLEQNAMFWISAGLLLYFAGSALLFLSSNYLLAYSKALNMQVWVTHAFLLFLLYACYLVALCLPQPK